MIDLTPLQQLPKNVGDLGKFIVAKGFKSCPKSNKSPNLVTLFPTDRLKCGVGFHKQNLFSPLMPFARIVGLEGDHADH